MHACERWRSRRFWRSLLSSFFLSLSSYSLLCLFPNYARLSRGLPGSLGLRLSGPILGEASPPPTHPAGVERGMWSSQKPRPPDCHSPLFVRPLQDLTCTSEPLLKKWSIMKRSFDFAQLHSGEFFNTVLHRFVRFTVSFKLVKQADMHPGQLHSHI